MSSSPNDLSPSKLRFPSNKAFDEREGEQFIENINRTFNTETSMIERVALYVLFLNFDKFEGIVILLIDGYNKQNKTSLKIAHIQKALDALNKTSGNPFQKKSNGGANFKHMSQFIFMIASLVANIIIMEFLCNSLEYKVSNSVVMEEIGNMITVNQCKVKKELPVPLKWLSKKIIENELEYAPVVLYSIQVWECSNLANIMSAGLEEVEQKFDTSAMRPRGVYSDNGNDNVIKNEHSKPKTNQLALPMYPGDGEQNDSGVLLFDENIINQFKELQMGKELQMVNETQEKKVQRMWDESIALCDSIINNGHTDTEISTSEKETDIIDVLKWVGKGFLGLAEDALDSLKERRINPVFWNDVLPRLKMYAKKRRNALKRLFEDGEIRIEQAIDEIYSICLHIGFIYFFTVCKLSFQTTILYKFLKSVYKKKKIIFKTIKQVTSYDKNVLENNSSDDKNSSDDNNSSRALVVVKKGGGKSKKNKNRSGCKSKKNKTRKN